MSIEEEQKAEQKSEIFGNIALVAIAIASIVLLAAAILLLFQIAVLMIVPLIIIAIGIAVIGPICTWIDALTFKKPSPIPKSTSEASAKNPSEVPAIKSYEKNPDNHSGTVIPSAKISAPKPDLQLGTSPYKGIPYKNLQRHMTSVIAIRIPLIWRMLRFFYQRIPIHPTTTLIHIQLPLPNKNLLCLSKNDPPHDQPPVASSANVPSSLDQTNTLCTDV